MNQALQDAIDRQYAKGRVIDWAVENFVRPSSCPAVFDHQVTVVMRSRGVSKQRIIIGEKIEDVLCIAALEAMGATFDQEEASSVGRMHSVPRHQSEYARASSEPVGRQQSWRDRPPLL